MTNEIKEVNEIVELIVETFEAHGARNVSPDTIMAVRGVILSHGRLMRTEGSIEANRNSMKIIEGVFGND